MKVNDKFALACIPICVALLAGCDRMKEPVAKPKTESPSPVSQLPPQISSAPAASKAGVAPIQGQVDPKEPAQRRDFDSKKP